MWTGCASRVPPQVETERGLAWRQHARPCARPNNTTDFFSHILATFYFPNTLLTIEGCARMLPHAKPPHAWRRRDNHGPLSPPSIRSHQPHLMNMLTKGRTGWRAHSGGTTLKDSSCAAWHRALIACSC